MKSNALDDIIEGLIGINSLFLIGRIGGKKV